MTTLKSVSSSGAIIDYTGNLNITQSGTGILTNKDLEIVKIYNDSYYINQDTFSYLLILVFVGVLLFRTTLKIFSISFNYGFSLTSNERNILGKK